MMNLDQQYAYAAASLNADRVEQLLTGDWDMKPARAEELAHDHQLDALAAVESDSTLDRLLKIRDEVMAVNNPAIPVMMPGALPTAGKVACPYEQAIFRPELTHSARQNKLQGTWDVTGPDGYYRACHHEDEAEAIAAFWSGDQLRAEEHRRRALARRGLIKPEEM
jgi:hypothetical protein